MRLVCVRSFAWRESLRGAGLRFFAAAAAKRGGGGAALRSWEDVYQRKTPVEHVLLRPDTYVGSVDVSAVERWVLKGKQMELERVSYVPALYKVFDEVLVNATDNARRDASQTFIKVDVDVAAGSITVHNDGKSVPAVFHQREQVHIPELVFGHLLTGSNFDDDAQKREAIGGRNGYGAKLANIFSSRFEVEIWDAEHDVHYVQTWRDNMSKVEAPSLTKLVGKNRGVSGTRVSFVPDKRRFPPLSETDILSVMRTRCFDVAACNPKLRVTFNGEVIPSSFEGYFKLFDLHSLGSVFSSIANGWELGVGVTDTPSQARHVSFVNSINTLRGGTHVDHVTDQIARGVAAAMKKDASGPAVPAATIKSHLIVFLNAFVTNPTFDSQTKETLTTKSTELKDAVIPESFIQRVRLFSFLFVCLSLVPCEMVMTSIFYERNIRFLLMGTYRYF